MSAFFLFGFERSGTTLLAMMTGAHPRIAVPLSATGLWYRYGDRLVEYGGLADRAGLERLVDDLLAEERIRLWDARLGRDELLAGLPLGSYPAVIDRFHQLYARAKGKDLWGDHDIATLDHVDRAALWFPRARFAHIVRDGRDVALSHRTMPYGASNLGDCAKSWERRVSVNLKVGAVLGPDRYLLLRYEDLVAAPEAELRRLCIFLGVAWEPAMLDYPRMVEDKIPAGRRWLHPVLDRPPERARAYRWKTAMRPAARAAFETEPGVRELLARLGYETGPVPRKSLAVRALRLWFLLDEGARMRRLAARLGLRRKSRLEREWARTRGAVPSGWAAERRRAHEALIERGVYGAEFEHAPELQDFVEECLRGALARDGGSDRPLAVLEAGCGTGSWLDRFARRLAPAVPAGCRLYGFDLTPGMVEVARRRLAGAVPPGNLRAADILDAASYAFDGLQAFDLIWAYDVIQQLPPSLQLAACRTVLRQLAPGGTAVLFDHDRHSRYGRRMALRKLLTRYLRLPLVPRWFLGARYPPLARFAREIEGLGGFAAEVRDAPDGRKRALIVRAAPAPGPRSPGPA